MGDRKEREEKDPNGYSGLRGPPARVYTADELNGMTTTDLREIVKQLAIPGKSNLKSRKDFIPAILAHQSGGRLTVRVYTVDELKDIPIDGLHEITAQLNIPKRHTLFSRDQLISAILASQSRISTPEPQRLFDEHRAIMNIGNMLNRDIANGNGHKFSALLSDTKSCIAGSYPLQAVLNVNWNEEAGTDIDVWVDEHSDIGLLFSTLLEYGYIWRGTFNDDLQRLNLTDDMDYVRLRSTIDKMYTFVKNDFLNIQVLVLKKGLTVDSAVSNFDLSICQIIYDGRRIYTLAPDLERQLETKMTYVTESARKNQSFFEWMRSLKRIEKYQKRGIATDPSVWKDLDIFSTCKVKYYGALEQFFNRWNERARRISRYMRPEFAIIPERQDVVFGLMVNNRDENKWRQVASSVKHFEDIEETDTLDTSRELYLPFDDTVPENTDFSETSQKGFPKLEYKTCLDIAMYEEDASVEGYFKENADGIVIIVGPKAVCYSLDELKKVLSDKSVFDTTVYYECKPNEELKQSDVAQFPDNKEEPYVLIRLEANFTVPLRDLAKVIRAFGDEYRFVEIVPWIMDDGKQKKLERTVSHGIYVRTSNAVSADHCQGGTSKLVYRLKILGKPGDVKLPKRAPMNKLNEFMSDIADYVIREHIKANQLHGADSKENIFNDSFSTSEAFRLAPSFTAYYYRPGEDTKHTGKLWDNVLAIVKAIPDNEKVNNDDLLTFLFGLSIRMTMFSVPGGHVPPFIPTTNNYQIVKTIVRDTNCLRKIAKKIKFNFRMS